MPHPARLPTTAPGRRAHLLLRLGAAASVAALLAGCGGQSTTSSSASSPASSAGTSVGSSAPASDTAVSTDAATASSSAEPSVPAESSADSSGAPGSSGPGAPTSIVPAPTGDALTAVLDAKCAAFGESLEGAAYGLSDIKQIEDARGVCRWEATGLSQPAVLSVDPRVADSAQADQRDRELACADVSPEGAEDPQSNRAKRVAQQVRSGLYYYPAGDADGLATLTTYREGASGLDGGISLGCDASYAYEVRIYTTAPLTANLSGTSLVAAHRAG